MTAVSDREWRDVIDQGVGSAVRLSPISRAHVTEYVSRAIEPLRARERQEALDEAAERLARCEHRSLSAGWALIEISKLHRVSALDPTCLECRDMWPCDTARIVADLFARFAPAVAAGGTP